MHSLYGLFTSDIWWNMLNQQIVGATSLNALKNGLDKLRKTKMDFFMD